MYNLDDYYSSEALLGISCHRGGTTNFSPSSVPTRNLILPPDKPETQQQGQRVYEINNK